MFRECIFQVGLHRFTDRKSREFRRHVQNDDNETSKQFTVIDCLDVIINITERAPNGLHLL
jgi:hypothetical protein